MWGMLTYLQSFVTSSDQGFCHIALWTCAQLLKCEYRQFNFLFLFNNINIANNREVQSSKHILTRSASKWIFWYFCTLGHLNGSSFLNIHHRNLPIVPFNSELNSTHFWLKNSRLHEKLAGCPLGKEHLRHSFPKRYRQIGIQWRMLPFLFYPIALKCVHWQHNTCGYHLGD